VEQYEYSPYGEATVLDGNGGDLSGESAVGNPYLFTARRFDEETGLYHYRARAYNPECGRFMQRDPLRYADSLCLYEHVGSNPCVFIDPLGENKWKTFNTSRTTVQSSHTCDPLPDGFKRRGTIELRYETREHWFIGIKWEFESARPELMWTTNLGLWRVHWRMYELTITIYMYYSEEQWRVEDPTGVREAAQEICEGNRADYEAVEAAREAVFRNCIRGLFGGCGKRFLGLALTPGQIAEVCNHDLYELALPFTRGYYATGKEERLGSSSKESTITMTIPIPVIERVERTNLMRRLSGSLLGGRR